MPEVIVKYKSKKSLQLLEDLSKYHDFKIMPIPTKKEKKTCMGEGSQNNENNKNIALNKQSSTSSSNININNTSSSSTSSLEQQEQTKEYWKAKRTQVTSHF